jgi:uncharacterized protein DUF402
LSWRRGDTVVLQEVWRGQLWAARPMVVEHDRGDDIALWFPKRTRWKAPTTPPGRPRAQNRGQRLCSCMASGEWVFRDLEWDVDTLCLFERGAAYAIWISWLDGFEPWGWYVNLQEPFRKRPHALQTMDLMLDVIVGLDRGWRWKDEDEFQALLDWRLIDSDAAAAVREEALGVLRRLELDEPPFSEPWHDWRPDPSWGLPELPPGWTRL